MTNTLVSLEYDNKELYLHRNITRHVIVEWSAQYVHMANIQDTPL